MSCRAGLLTGHPIELVIVIGLLLMGLVGIPEARWFFGGSDGEKTQKNGPVRILSIRTRPGRAASESVPEREACYLPSLFRFNRW